VLFVVNRFLSTPILIPAPATNKKKRLHDGAYREKCAAYKAALKPNPLMEAL